MSDELRRDIHHYGLVRALLHHCGVVDKEGYKPVSRLSISNLASVGWLFVNVIGASHIVCGLVGSGWLVLRGHWRLFFGGIAVAVMMPGILGLLLPLLSLPVGFAAISAKERGRRRLALTLLWLSVLYQHCLIAAWCFLGYYLLLHLQSSLGTSWPLMLWAYAVTTFTLTGAFVDAHTENIGNFVGVFVGQVVFLVVLVLHALCGLHMSVVVICTLTALAVEAFVWSFCVHESIAPGALARGRLL